MKILLAVHNEEVRSALRILISKNFENDEIIEAINYLSFFEKLTNKDLKIILFDWLFFNSKAGEIIKLIKKDFPYLNMICIDINDNNEKVAVKSKVDAFYFEDDSPKNLLKLIEIYRKK